MDKVWDLCLEGLQSESAYPFSLPSSISEISYPYAFRKGPLQMEAERQSSEDNDHQSLALQHLASTSEPLHFLAEMQYSKEASGKSSEKDDIFVDSDEEDDLEDLSILRLDAKGLQDAIRELPSDWRIIQINARPNPYSRFSSMPRSEVGSDENPELFLSRVSSSEPIDILRLPPCPHDPEAGPNIRQELAKIMHLHSSLYQSHSKDYSKKDFIDLKRDVDIRIASLLDTMEARWLGFGASWLLGKPVDTKRRTLLKETAENILGSQSNPRVAARLSYLLDAVHHLSEENLLLGLCEMNLGEDAFKSLLKFRSENPDDPFIKRHPVIFILDSEVQQLPWDSLPILRGHPVSRVPSLKFLLIIYKKHEGSRDSVLKAKELSNDVYYILNPDQNLGRTQERLEDLFKEELHMEGSSGKHPPLSELERVLNSKEGFMYCGHGSSLKNLPLQRLESLKVRAMPLLFGCKSGRLERIGRKYDPMGTANSYMIATAPALLGFLWSITDKDIDAWTASFLRFWFEKENRSLGLVEAVAAKKSEFSRIINGASTVVYGLPQIR